MMLPKAAVAADMYALDRLLAQIEAAHGITRRIGVEALIERAHGVANVELFGRRHAAAQGPAFRQHLLRRRSRRANYRHRRRRRLALPALARLLNACRARGLCALDGSSGDIADDAGLQRAAERGAARLAWNLLALDAAIRARQV